MTTDPVHWKDSENLDACFAETDAHEMDVVRLLGGKWRWQTTRSGSGLRKQWVGERDTKDSAQRAAEQAADQDVASMPHLSPPDGICRRDPEGRIEGMPKYRDDWRKDRLP